MRKILTTVEAHVLQVEQHVFEATTLQQYSTRVQPPVERRLGKRGFLIVSLFSSLFGSSNLGCKLEHTTILESRMRYWLSLEYELAEV